MRILTVSIIYSHMSGLKKARAKIESWLAVALAHMYKCEHYSQFSQGGRGWIITINETKSNILKVLSEYKWLEDEMDDNIQKVWKKAIKIIIKDLNKDIELSDRDFPEICPYTWNDLLNFTKYRKDCRHET